ncbi:MAG: hypothetical protein HYW57_03955 [Ignavibacteriales bacterium]|nr:hypothetical protein [Ignavibacteriales bacterium]
MKEIQRELEERRRSERRECPQCGYGVDNPFCERCPRCNTPLPKMELYCTGCAVSSFCPVWKSHVAGEQAGEVGSVGGNTRRDGWNSNSA